MRLFDDNPWGTLVFLFIFGGGLLGALVGANISLADYLAAVATAGGPFGVGHSVHRGARHIARRTTRLTTSPPFFEPSSSGLFARLDMRARYVFIFRT
jgi:hypothetical protein